MNNLTVGHWTNQWPQMHHVKVATWSISWSFMISPSNFSITAIMSVAQIFGTRGSKFDVNFVKSLNLSLHSSPFRTESFTVVLETLALWNFYTIFKTPDSYQIWPSSTKLWRKILPCTGLFIKSQYVTLYCFISSVWTTKKSPKMGLKPFGLTIIKGIHTNYFVICSDNMRN